MMEARLFYRSGSWNELAYDAHFLWLPLFDFPKTLPEFDFSHGIAENGLSFWYTCPVLQQPMPCCCFLSLFLLLLGGLCLLDTEMLSSFMSLFYRGNLKVSKSTNNIFWVSFLTWIVCVHERSSGTKLSSIPWVWLFLVHLLCTRWVLGLASGKKLLPFLRHMSMAHQLYLWKFDMITSSLGSWHQSCRSLNVTYVKSWVWA